MELVIELPSLKAVRDEMKAVGKVAEASIQKAINDTVVRAPAQITKAVTAVYGIKSSEVSAAGKKAAGSKKSIGNIKVAGITAEGVRLVYSGRPLTLTHFSMTPRAAPDARQQKKLAVPGMAIATSSAQGAPVAMISPPKKYKVKANIWKGKKEIFENAFIATGNGGSVLAFTREDKRGKETKRSPIKAIRTVGIPQMIEKEIVKSSIQSRIDEILSERINHHTERAIQKISK